MILYSTYLSTFYKASSSLSSYVMYHTIYIIFEIRKESMVHHLSNFLIKKSMQKDYFRETYQFHRNGPFAFKGAAISIDWSITSKQTRKIEHIL